MQLITKSACGFAATLLLTLPVGLQAQGRGHGHGNSRGASVAQSGQQEHGRPVDAGAGQDNEKRGAANADAGARGANDGVVISAIDPRRGARGPRQRPPGWDRGRKTGWNGSNVPPGLDGRGAGQARMTTRSRNPETTRSSASGSGSLPTRGRVGTSQKKSSDSPPESRKGTKPVQK